MFRRKKWKYLILDEAHMIKNWKSQRWQTLLNFNSKRRLLITGQPSIMTKPLLCLAPNAIPDWLWDALHLTKFCVGKVVAPNQPPKQAAHNTA